MVSVNQWLSKESSTSPPNPKKPVAAIVLLFVVYSSYVSDFSHLVGKHASQVHWPVQTCSFGKWPTTALELKNEDVEQLHIFGVGPCLVFLSLCSL